VIEETRHLWRDTRDSQIGTRDAAGNLTGLKLFKVAPDDMTKASLIDNIVKARAVRITPAGPPIVTHSLLVSAEEFQVLLPDYDREFIGTLNSLYNNKIVHEESRRARQIQDISIDYPQLNILAGAQPSYLADTFPENAWATGLSRRLIMVYAHESPFRELWAEVPDLSAFRRHLLTRLSHMGSLYGEMLWTKDAAAMMAQQYKENFPPVPTHSKLVHWSQPNARLLQMLKLSVISAISRTGELVLEVADIERALDWLHEVERYWPDIFRAMTGKSDSQIVDELHYFVQATWIRDRQKPVSGALLREFLLQRIPHDKVESLLMVADKADIVVRHAGTDDLWVPRPRLTARGVE
jgi:hypothetical protein